LKYYSIDIETTGLNPKKDQILQVGIAFEDTENIIPISETPCKEWTIRYNRIEGDPFAIQMNANIIKHSIENPLPKDVIDRCSIIPSLAVFIRKCDPTIPSNHIPTINVAGKNFNGFDRLFLENIDGFSDRIRIRHRVLDPAMLYADWSKDRLPSLQDCLDKANILTTVKHTAMQDAIDVIKVIRARTNNYAQ